MVTRQELEAEANRLITAAKYRLELEGDFPPMFRVHLPSGWDTATLPAEWCSGMNNGKFKDGLFGVIRDAVKQFQVDGVILVGDTWCAVPTVEGKKHSVSELSPHLDSGFSKLIKMGWMTRREAMVVTAQNEVEVLTVSQFYARTPHIQLLECKREWFGQDCFRGRQKMFGDLREENIR